MGGPKCQDIVIGIAGVLGLIALIVVGSTVVREYNMAKNFKPTTCTALNVTDLGFRTCSYCYTTYTSTRRAGQKTRESKQKCRPSTFPCVKIDVKYADVSGRNLKAMYYPDVLQTTKSLTCSFYSCNRNVYTSEIEIRNAVELYKHQSSNGPFTCYYDVKNTHHVIGRKIHTYTEALVGMLIPGLITAGAIIWLIYRCCCGRSKSDSDGQVKMLKHDYNHLKEDNKDKGEDKEESPLTDPSGPGMNYGVVGPAGPIPTQPNPQGMGPYPPMPTYTYDPTKSTTPSFPPSVPQGGYQDPAFPPQGYPAPMPQGGNPVYPPMAPQGGYPGYPPVGGQGVPSAYPPVYPPPGPQGNQPQLYPGMAPVYQAAPPGSEPLPKEDPDQKKNL